MKTPQITLKSLRRRCRERRLQERYQSTLTTDDEPMSELKQGRYWTRQQRKEHLAKAKEYRQRAKFFQRRQKFEEFKDPLTSQLTTEDFNLLNRIFLRQNQEEFQTKPHLAFKYYQQSSMERNKLKRIIQENHFRRISSVSSISQRSNSTYFHPPSTVIL